MWSLTITLFIIALCIIWGYGKWRCTYWSSRGVDGPSTIPYIGNTIALFTDKEGLYLKDIYFKFKEKKICGTYSMLSPSLYIHDPELIKNVMVKDFDHFTDRRIFETDGKYEWINEMLTSVNGKQWKALRTALSPAFSSGKMKFMYQTVLRQADNLVKYFGKSCDDKLDVDVKEVSTRFVMDVIASAAFGMEINSINNKKCVFTENANNIFKANFQTIMIFLLTMFLPKKVCSFFGLTFANKSWDFFLEVSNQTLEARRKSGEKRGDFLDLMLEEQEKQKENFDESKHYKITDDTILASAVLFLIAGNDTISSTVSFTTHYIAKNQDIQDKLREELENAKDSDGKLDYHKLMEAKYLEACIHESMRIVSAAPLLERLCTQDYLIPNTNVVVKKGMYVQVPVWGLHHDPEYWPEPMEFKPERFLPENKSNIIPFTHIPFGVGPRNCIAMRFALMETKTVLASLVLNYKFTLAEGHEELTYTQTGGVTRPVKGCNIILHEL